MGIKRTSHGGEFEISINGSKLDPELEAAVVAIEVERGIHMADRADVTFSDPRWKVARDKRFKHGDTVDVVLPYDGTPTKVFTGGKIGRVDVDSNKEEGHFLRISAFGPRYTLAKGVQSQAFLDAQVGASLKKTVSAAGLGAKAGNTPQRTYLLQANVANRSLIEEFAARTGLVVMEEGSQLAMSPPEMTDSGVSLSFGVELLRFRVDVSTLGPLAAMHGSAHDMKQKSVWTTDAKSCSLSASGWSTYGHKLVGEKFGSTPSELSDLPVKGSSELEKLVQSIFDDRAFSFVTGEGLSWGAPTLQVGKIIKLEGLGKRLSGAYYVTRLVHKIDRSAGFTTHFEACRPALAS